MKRVAKKSAGYVAIAATSFSLMFVNAGNAEAAYTNAQLYGQANVVPPVMGQAGYVAVPEPQTIIAAYQKAYAMNFEVWKPQGLPAGWYATFDGFPVAQVAEHRWVYGRMDASGVLAPTTILVGSVVPMEVPGITRVTTTWVYSRYLNNETFWKILERGCDRLGFLNEPLLRTPIAWNSHEAAIVWVWLGDRWTKIVPQRGEYSSQALRRKRQWIIDELHKSRFWWWGSEPWDLADLARQRGLIWLGKVDLARMPGYNVDNRDARSPSVAVDRSTPTTPEAPSQPDNTPDDGNWDVD